MSRYNGNSSNVVKFGSENGSIEGEQRANQFKYSKSKFQINLLIAAALTLMVCLFVWMILGIWGSPNANFYTFIAGLIFFAFISFKMVRQYVQSKTILSITPNGLHDSRHNDEIIPWEEIKEITLGLREEAFILSVRLWPKENSPKTKTPNFQIDLEPLDSKPNTIVALINEYKQVTVGRE